jgi:hypothetical protein
MDGAPGRARLQAHQARGRARALHPPGGSGWALALATGWRLWVGGEAEAALRAERLPSVPGAGRGRG